ncbi:3388_t:CDS:2 [Cetraspora pellucida]|uniref:3388_t:CDS:1 n=1 Tax=Cetraspora pellucida TaxID=1433469 RepID=A0A9N9IQE4_9GLOM|nr:3388_t:CDS:2 [Cetraspora pellucida]
MSTPSFHSLIPSEITASTAYKLLDLSRIFPPLPINVQRYISPNNRKTFKSFKSLRNQIFRENVRQEAKMQGIDRKLIKGLFRLDPTQDFDFLDGQFNIF